MIEVPIYNSFMAEVKHTHLELFSFAVHKSGFRLYFSSIRNYKSALCNVSKPVPRYNIKLRQMR